jgi:thiamine biosynthesis protein ThiS
MQLVVNGEVAIVPEGLTVAGLVRHLGIDGPVAVERNVDVIPRAEHESTVLVEGDKVEIVHFVGGG